MESTPPAARMWGLNNFNTTFPTIFTPRQEPGPASDLPSVSSDINLNLFQHFILVLKLPVLTPPPVITNGATETIMEDIYTMCQE